MRVLPLFAALAAAALAPLPVAAQSCPALTQPARCTAAAPADGQSFSGTVLQVIDSATLCVAFGPTPDQWLRVRLVDADAAVSRGQMMTAAFAQSVDCKVVRREDGEVVAACSAKGVSLVRTAASAHEAAPAPGAGSLLATL